VGTANPPENRGYATPCERTIEHKVASNRRRVGGRLVERADQASQPYSQLVSPVPSRVHVLALESWKSPE
jgi:hypothetical protein